MPKGWSSSSRRRDSDDDEGGTAAVDAQPDDLIKPAGIENGQTPPFGALCGLFEQFESITRNKHKKNEKKGEVLQRFFEVRPLPLIPACWSAADQGVVLAAVEDRGRPGPVPRRPPHAPRGAPALSPCLPDAHELTTSTTYLQRDTRRRTYNLKEQKLAKALIAALDIPPHNSTALKLLNWKVPTAQDVRPRALRPVARPAADSLTRSQPGAGEFACASSSSTLFLRLTS